MKATEESILAFDFSLNSISEKMSALSVSESSTSLRMFTTKFDINREIYNSPNSTVYLVNQKLPGALKLVLGHTQSNLLIKEYKILRSLDHPHIIKPLGHEIGVMSDETLAAYLLVPYYKNGEMFDYVKERSGLGELKSHFHFSQIWSAVKYLHDNEIAHRDIKLENIMIDDEMNAQLIDLGFCYKCDSSFNNSDSEIIGSPAYMAPELLATLNCVQSESADGKACDQATDKLEKYKSGDVYALGITLFTMVVGIPPFAQASKFDPNYRAFLLSNKRPGSLHFWKKHPKAKDMLAKSEISKEFIELFEGMWNPDSSTRFSLESVMSHPWFEKFSDLAQNEF